MLFSALAYASEVGADLAHRAVDFVHADRPRRSGLLFAVIAAADEAAAVGNRTVGDADVAGVVVAAEEAEEAEGDKCEAFHGGLDAPARDVFTPGRLEKARIALDNGETGDERPQQMVHDQT